MNAQSLTSHFDEIAQYVQQSDPIILALAETRLISEIDDEEVKLNNYCLFRQDSDSRHTGGVALYVRSDYGSKVIMKRVLQKNYWFLLIKTTIVQKSWYIGVIYHSPNESHSVFLDNFENIIDEISLDAQDEFLVIGDFNIDIGNVSTYSNRIRNIIQFNGFKQSVSNPTRVTSTTSTTIDLVITNNFNINANVLTTPRITDHYIISIRLDITNMQDDSELRWVRDKIDYDKLNNKLIECNWMYENTDISTLYKNFYNNIVNALNFVAPLNRKVVLYNNSKPWINSKVVKSFKERDRSYKKYMISRNIEDWVAYKSFRNKTTNLIREEKHKYFENKIDNCKQNSLDMWKTLKSIIKLSNNEEVQELNVEGTLVKGKVEIAKKFNEFFIKSVEDITQSIPVQSTTSNINIDSINLTKPCFDKFELLSLSELKKIVSDLKNKKSTDCIGMDVIKNTFEIIGYPLLHIINTSLTKSTIPSELKISTVIPIPKVTGTNKIEEFRPINMLPACEKIFEKIVYEQLLKYLDENSIFTKFQSGFRRKFSCESAIQYVVSEWKNYLDDDLHIGAVFLDLKRAFETIDRDILLVKLKKYGIGGEVLQWLQNYLSDRKQIVNWKNVESDPIENNLGVPQGSILGPLLFILYINDIPEIIKEGKINLFADDTMIYVVNKDVDVLVSILQNELIRVNKYMSVNKLKLNTNKTKFMLLCSDNQLTIFKSKDLNINIGGENIELVTHIKYLGIIIDRKLKFEMHVDYISKKVAKKINFMNRISKQLTQWSRLLIYNTIIMPHFTYCSTIFYLINQTQIAKLQLLQNRAMRIILGCNRYTSINVMLKCLNWLDVKKIVIFNCMVFVYKLVKGLLPEYFQAEKNCDIHDYNTRQKDHFHVVKKNKECTKKSILHQGLVEYNSLPKELKEIDTLVKFKVNLKKHYSVL